MTPPRRPLFGNDPEVKEEKIWVRPELRPHAKPVLVMDRRDPTAWLRTGTGTMEEYAFSLVKHESVLSQILDLHRYPELNLTRQTLLTWRFYHQFRTDARSPLRYPQIGLHTDVLSQDGSDLAAALETIIEIGDEDALADTVARAFGGARLRVDEHSTLFSFALEIPGLLRPLSAREFSDGQLRFLCLAAALLSPRSPALIALNEPETSLHPALYAPLAELIGRASRASQIWVTTHSRLLADQIAGRCQVEPIELTLVEGETRLAKEWGTPRRPYQRPSKEGVQENIEAFPAEGDAV